MTIHTTLRAPAAAAPSLEELAARAVRLGRETAALARDCGVGASVEEWRRVARCLAGPADRIPFEGPDDEAYVVALGVLERHIEQETEGTERRVVGYDVDEDGVRYDLLGEVPAHTPRGLELLKVRARLWAFLAARDEVLDRVAAQRALRGLLEA